jgi:hypothetical protein
MTIQGYPEILLVYCGQDLDVAEQVIVMVVAEEGAEPMVERFKRKIDAREDEVIQSARCVHARPCFNL